MRVERVPIGWCVVHQATSPTTNILLRKRQIKLNGQKDKRISSTTCGGPTRRTYHRRRRGQNHRPLLFDYTYGGRFIYIGLVVWLD
ncbi:hypothetical protein YC2023_074178 [Brassica napus]